MDNKFRDFYSEEDIIKLTPEELDKLAGGASNQAKCPICKQYVALRSMKSHLRSEHGM